MLAVQKQRGDTLIEVILASAIFAMVTVSTFAIMQRASSNTYDAMERSQVRLLLNGQADLLYYLRDEHSRALASGQSVTTGQAAVWNTLITGPYNTTTPNLDACLPAAPATTPSQYFFIQKGATQYELKSGADITAASGLPAAGKGIWVQRVDSGGNAANKQYKDFYVMACWDNTTNGVQHMSSIVRMYNAN